MINNIVFLIGSVAWAFTAITRLCCPEPSGIWYEALIISVMMAGHIEWKHKKTEGE